jgi:hypothetical protein
MRGRVLLKRLAGEEGQILAYVLKILLAFAVIGFLISQCGPIIWNHITTRTTAGDAAELAARIYEENNGNMEKVYERVRKMLDERGARLDGQISVEMDASGRAVSISVPVRKIVNTYLFENVGYLAPYTEATAVGEHSITM